MRLIHTTFGGGNFIVFFSYIWQQVKGISAQIAVRISDYWNCPAPSSSFRNMKVAKLFNCNMMQKWYCIDELVSGMGNLNSLLLPACFCIMWNAYLNGTARVLHSCSNCMEKVVLNHVVTKIIVQVTYKVLCTASPDGSAFSMLPVKAECVTSNCICNPRVITSSIMFRWSFGIHIQFK